MIESAAVGAAARCEEVVRDLVKLRLEAPGCGAVGEIYNVGRPPPGVEISMILSFAAGVEEQIPRHKTWGLRGWGWGENRAKNGIRRGTNPHALPPARSSLKLIAALGMLKKTLSRTSAPPVSVAK